MASTRVAPSSSSAASSDLGAKSMGSLGVDEYLRNIYGDAGEGRAVDVWGDTSGGRRGDDGEVTLEDFLARAGAVREEDVRAAVAASVFEVDPVGLGIENQVLGFGNEVEGVRGGGGRGGRGRKRPAMDPVDRAAVQRQKRMIKNRESAARSRERKQAYTVELETLVTQLEEENARLLKELEEQNRVRLPQLLKNLIPVTEERKPPRALRRTGSAMW